MPVPFKVKAIYEYRSDEPDDLIFDNGQIITVTDEEDADWYTGEYTNAQGQTLDGIFPRNFVEKYEPAIPTRPSRAPRKVPQPEPAPEPEAPTAVTEATSPPPTISAVPAAVVSPPAHEPSKEAEIEPPREFTQPAAAPKPEPEAPVVESRQPPAKKPPPVVEKPTSSSFRDRIAAFNKPAAAPVAPFKPGAPSVGAGFVKKPYVAPPPSRNAYVPPPRDPPPQKIYRREEEIEDEDREPEPEPRPAVVSERSAPEEEEQPRTETLKERIARLQQQQLENAQRQAESTKKKDKPKRPTKTRTESADATAEPPEEGSQIERVSTERSRKQVDVHDEDDIPVRSTSDDIPAGIPPPASRELVSDTNDADDSGAGDTEDAQDISTEEERQKPRSVKSPPVVAKAEHPAEEEDEDEDTEEEEDPEVRRKRELRERMAKMSGGMGMMGMFGAGAAPAPRKAKTAKEERAPEPPQEEEQTQRAPPIPLMALPGMSKPPPRPAPMPEPDEEPESAEPTPIATQDAGLADDDYVSQKTSRRSTERSQPLSPRDRIPPPVPEDRPEAPQSPGARPVPPPPPPTKQGDLPQISRHEDSEDELDEEVVHSAPRPPPVTTSATPRAVPPPPPPQAQSPISPDAPRAVPPVPMSPTSPQSRPPPPPPPGQAPPRRSTTQSSLEPQNRGDSEDEVTEYDGDYDTDIASSAKHKAALKSHNRDSSLDEGALSDDAGNEIASQPVRAAAPPIPASVPRDAPPPLPPQAAPRPRESVDAPRAAPPPIPPIPTQQVPKQRDSVESPRAAPPPIPPPKSPIDDDEYDPYRHTSPHAGGLPSMIASLRKPTEEFDDDDYEEERDEVPDPPGRAAPPPPPVERVPPPPPPQAAAVYTEPEAISMSGALSAPPKRSSELGRSNSRRSGDANRPSIDQGFIAADVDLGQNSMWWAKDNNPPPALLNRNDVLWEVESSTNQKRGGRSSVSRDVYVLYQDYSQTTVNATFDSAEPNHVAFEQNHERPPVPPRKDQLEGASEQFGAQIAKGAEKAVGSIVGEGTAQEFVLALIRPMQAALLPVGSRAYGALVYANLANASTQQFDEIRAGDIITFRNAKFAGHKGGLHQKYSQEVGKPEHVGVVIDWDGTKKKIRAWEQGNQEKGKKAKVREESYRVSDLKSGEVRVWRVMPRSYVNWGTA